MDGRPFRLVVYNKRTDDGERVMRACPIGRGYYLILLLPAMHTSHPPFIIRHGLQHSSSDYLIWRNGHCHVIWVNFNILQNKSLHTLSRHSNHPTITCFAYKIWQHQPL
jgi:hypothetical protein